MHWNHRGNSLFFFDVEDSLFFFDVEDPACYKPWAGIKQKLENNERALRREKDYDLHGVV